MYGKKIFNIFDISRAITLSYAPEGTLYSLTRQGPAAGLSLSSSNASTSTQGLISVDNRGLNDEAEHHLRVSHFANQQVIVFLDIRL